MVRDASIIGIARELAAVTKRELREPEGANSAAVRA
jgi:phenylalanyl-tRNA synthetase beta subunit